jgi:hypothetical protein
MDTHPKTIVGALEEIAARVGTSLEKIAATIRPTNDGQLSVYQKAISDPREEVILCYTAGSLQFVPGPGGEKYGLLDMGLYTLEGELNGRYQVVWQPFPNVPPQDLYDRPPLYTGPWDKVEQTIPQPMLRANSNASYSFEGKGPEGVGTIYATGPANLLLVPLNDESQMFVISVCTYVTGGSGAYERCWGVNTALGSSFVPKGVDVLNVPYGQKIPGVTVSTFRVVRAYNIGRQPRV